MGKHSKPEPKKISFLASTGGALAGLALVGGLYAANSVNRPDDREVITNEPVTEAPNTPTADPLLLGNATTVQANTDPSVQVPDVAVETPERVPTPAPPVVSPKPPQANTGPSVDVDANVQVPPVAGVDVDAEVEVPLVGQVLDTTAGAVKETTKTVKGVTDPVIGTVKDLLGE